MSQNLSSAAVVICALRVNLYGFGYIKYNITMSNSDYSGDKYSLRSFIS